MLTALPETRSDRQSACGRYWAMVPGAAVSYTELEFDEASVAGLPRLVFLLKDRSGLPAMPADANREAVEGFRQRLRDAGLVVREFTSAADLELEVFHALTEVAAGDGGRAWAGEFNSLAVPGGVAAATRTLPRDIASSTGREDELQQLMGSLGEAEVSGGVVSIWAIGGMAGIGKTAFAVHAAHKLARQFPDGQIFLPLHGHTPGHRPVDPADALASLLRAIGLQRVPAGLGQRMWLWRDRVAGKRLLLVLDDAAGHEQVRPLLPGTAGSLVLITSRRHLTALEDAKAISLDILRPEDAAGLLIRLASRPGLSIDDQAVREITRLCGYLPLAIGSALGSNGYSGGWACTPEPTSMRTPLPPWMTADLLTHAIACRRFTITTCWPSHPRAGTACTT